VFELYLVKLATIFIATALHSQHCDASGPRDTAVHWPTNSPNLNPVNYEVTHGRDAGACPHCTPILDVADLKQHLIGRLEFAGLEND